MANTRIDLCFHGYVQGAEVTNVHVTATGEDLYIGDNSVLRRGRPQPSDTEVLKNIEEGIWLISLERSLDHCDKSEVELHEFELTK